MTVQNPRSLCDQILVSPWAEDALRQAHQAVLQQLVEDVDMFFPSSAHFEWLYSPTGCDGFYLRQTAIECNSDARLVLLTSFWVEANQHCLLRCELIRFGEGQELVPSGAEGLVARFDVWNTKSDQTLGAAAFSSDPLAALQASLVRTGYSSRQDTGWTRASEFTDAVISTLAP